LDKKRANQFESMQMSDRERFFERQALDLSHSFPLMNGNYSMKSTDAMQESVKQNIYLSSAGGISANTDYSTNLSMFNDSSAHFESKFNPQDISMSIPSANVYAHNSSFNDMQSQPARNDSFGLFSPYDLNLVDLCTSYQQSDHTEDPTNIFKFHKDSAMNMLNHDHNQISEYSHGNI
jgi:hypothetical protein